MFVLFGGEDFHSGVGFDYGWVHELECFEELFAGKFGVLWMRRGVGGRYSVHV